MNREFIEQLNDLRPFCFETEREEQWYNIGLIDGLEVGDTEPREGLVDIENAAKWLKENAGSYWMDDYDLPTDDLVKDFRESMKR